MSSRADKASSSPAQTAADVLGGVVAVLVLLLAVAVGLLLGLELVTAAAGDPHSYWRLVPSPESGAARAAILCGLVVLFALAMALAARPRGAGLALPVDGGAVLLRQLAVVELVEQQFAAHPDVVRTQAEVRARADGLVVDVRAFLRPGAEATRLEPEVREAGVAGVRVALGVAPQVRRLKLRVLKVNELVRHL
jgi:hypothetical protein